MAYTLGFSPCPNDTFIFDAMVNGLIDIGGLEFEPIMQDVETLNQLSLEGRMDITKLSYAVLPQVQEHYILLNSGSALGKGCGPLLIGKDKEYPTIEDQSVAIPGQHTTAHLLFTMAYPNARKKIFIRLAAIRYHSNQHDIIPAGY